MSGTLAMATDGWTPIEFKASDGVTIRGGMQMGNDNILVIYQKHADSNYSEKFSFSTPSSTITSEQWYYVYSTKNITASTSDLTAGSSALPTNSIRLTYS